jgi:hypothetical protein
MELLEPLETKALMVQQEPLDCRACKEFKAFKDQLEALGRKERKDQLVLQGLAQQGLLEYKELLGHKVQLV